jgi:hypothetical protein
VTRYPAPREYLHSSERAKTASQRKRGRAQTQEKFQCSAGEMSPLQRTEQEIPSQENAEIT